MFRLRVCQLKLVRCFPCGGWSVPPTGCHPLDKRFRQPTWYANGMASEDFKKGEPFKDADLKTLLNGLGCAYKEIPWGEVGKAPNPVFWSSMAAAAGFWVPPMTSLVFGYWHWLSYCEVCWAALSCSFMGGIRYGLTVEQTLKPDWYNLASSAIPPFIGFLSLTFLPQLFAYPVLLSTMVVSSAHDALQSQLPVWFRSLRLMVVASSTMAMLLMFFFKIMHLGS